MAMKVNNPNGFTSLLKEGYKHFEEAVYRNITACCELSNLTRTSFGPHGMNKMIVNTLEKMFVTSDAATMMREMEVVHPAAKLLVMACQQQEQESGDGTNLVLIFAGELLKGGEALLKMGMHASEIVEGYELAFDMMMQRLESSELCVGQISGSLGAPANNASLSADAFKLQCRDAVASAIGSKQYGYETFLSGLVLDAAAQVMPWHNQKAFQVDAIRIVKIMGGHLLDSHMIPGMVFGRQPESVVQQARDCKVAVFACPVDIGRTETKGTVLLQDAKALLAFSRDEETNLEASIESILAGGVKVVVTGGTFGDLALHYLNRHGILCFKVPSKFDLQRLCRVLGATASARLGPLSPEELGYCDLVTCMDLGGDRVTVFRQLEEKSIGATGTVGGPSKMHAKVASIVVRGSTLHTMDDMERALDDGIQTIKTLVSRDGRLVAGAGQTENNLANHLAMMADTTPGLSQYAIRKFSEALYAIPTILQENATHAGIEPLPIAPTNDATHHATLGHTNESPIVVDVLATKKSALHLATDAALSVLRVDSIIMSKPAGGPKAPGAKKNWDED